MNVPIQRRHRISKTLLTEAARIAKDLGVTVRLEPDGSIVINPPPEDPDKEPTAAELGLEEW